MIKETFKVELTFLKTDEGEIIILPGMTMRTDINNQEVIKAMFGQPKAVKVACGKHIVGYPFKGSYIELR